MKKLFLSLSMIGALFVYAFALKHHNAEDGNRAITANPSTAITATTNQTPQVTVPTTNSSTNSSNNSPTTVSSKYKDGTYTGSSANAYYGNVQVRIIISGGQITDVSFINYPHDRSTSQMINTQAMPLLKQEAIQAQSANVSGVSGASLTSQAFIESLTSAINQAS